MAEDISSSMSSLNVLAVDGEILSKDELARHEKQMEHIREKLADLMAKLHRHKGSRRRPPDLGPPRTGQA
jgi:hypothetical protein